MKAQIVLYKPQNQILWKLKKDSRSLTSHLIKHTSHKSVAAEERILEQLEAYEDSTILPRKVVIELVEKLSQHTNYWTQKRIRDRRYNRYKRCNVYGIALQ